MLDVLIGLSEVRKMESCCFDPKEEAGGHRNPEVFA